jgi:hypothetical protein
MWENVNLYCSELTTSDGEKIKVIDSGKRTSDSGPDYSDALIKIGDRTLRGDVEIHRDADGWIQHSHKNNRAYNKVILHVVLWKSRKNRDIFVNGKRKLPLLILSSFLNRPLREIWHGIISNPSSNFKIPCSTINESVTNEEKISFVLKLSLKRLSQKKINMKERLREIIFQNRKQFTKNSVMQKIFWEQLLYENFFEALGYSKNKNQFIKLSRKLNIILIRKILSSGKKDIILRLQALLFGTSGLLNGLRKRDDYTESLKVIWNKYSDKYNITHLEPSEWLFFRLRPQNFPTVRIAYGAYLLEKILYTDFIRQTIFLFKSGLSYKQIYREFSSLMPSVQEDYWLNHYGFGKVSVTRQKLIGRQRIADIFINVVITFAVLYSEIFDDKEVSLKVRELYRNIKTRSDNEVVRKMNSQLFQGSENVHPTASLEQGILQLHNFYCIREKCRDCEIGRKVFRDGGYGFKIIYY